MAHVNIISLMSCFCTVRRTSTCTVCQSIENSDSKTSVFVWKTWRLCHKDLQKNLIPSQLCKGGAVASWLVRSSPDRAVRVPALARDIVYVDCVLGQDTLQSNKPCPRTQHNEPLDLRSNALIIRPVCLPILVIRGASYPHLEPILGNLHPARSSICGCVLVYWYIEGITIVLLSLWTFV